MAVLFILSIGIAFAAAVGIAMVAWRFISGSSSEQGSVSQPAFDLGVEQYAPMSRLLDDGDFQFLRVQPQFTPRMAALLREQRYRTFLAYLDRLRGDFNRTCSMLKHIIATADCDRPDLAAQVLHMQIAFAWARALAQVRAYAWRRGWGGVDAGQLLSVFGQLQRELRRLHLRPALAPSPWTAADDFMSL